MLETGYSINQEHLYNVIADETDAGIEKEMMSLKAPLIWPFNLSAYMWINDGF